MIKAILHKIMESDVVELVEPDRIVPLRVEGTKKAAIVYADDPIRRGASNADILEIKINVPTVGKKGELVGYALAKKIEKRLYSAINIAEDEHGWYHDGVDVLFCQVNGGGSIDLGDIDVYQRIIYFDVIWKERNGS